MDGVDKWSSLNLIQCILEVQNAVVTEDGIFREEVLVSVYSSFSTSVLIYLAYRRCIHLHVTGQKQTRQVFRNPKP